MSQLVRVLCGQTAKDMAVVLARNGKDSGWDESIIGKNPDSAKGYLMEAEILWDSLSPFSLWIYN